MLQEKSKINFDVTNEKHLQQFRSFLKYSKWGKEGCPFALEEPWHSIPDMIKDKISREFVGLV